MDLRYNFCSDKEPTDEQLEALMREVAAEARKEREKADRDYQLLIRKEINLAAKRMEALMKQRPDGKAE